MASNLDQYEFFNFYARYRWTADNFESFEQTYQFFTKAAARMFRESVVRGFGFQSAVGLSITVQEGLAFDIDGFPYHKSSATSSVVAGGPSAAQGRKSLVVARKVATNINNITDPNNPANTVPLNTREETEIVVIDGVIGSGVYPAKQANDVILFGIDFPANVSTVLAEYIDYSVREHAERQNDTGQLFKKYDAIVGVGPTSTHRTLNDVMADSDIGNIKEILVADTTYMTTTQTIDQSDKRIYFAPGVTLTKTSQTIGIDVTAQGIDIVKGRFASFNSGGDAAIRYQSGANYGLVIGTRFNDCDTTVDDQTTVGLNVSNIYVEA